MKEIPFIGGGLSEEIFMEKSFPRGKLQNANGVFRRCSEGGRMGRSTNNNKLLFSINQN
jgi:hypothetical protein